MALHLTLNLLPTFQPGEKVLVSQRRAWAASGRCFPLYRGCRVFFSLPPLWEAGIYITDQRLLLVAYLFRLLNQEVSLWYPGDTPAKDSDTIEQVRVGNGRLLGPYLETVSFCPEPHWYRSARVRLRLYTGNAESLCRLISGQIEKEGGRTV